jgi:hypothetical protein
VRQLAMSARCHLAGTPAKTSSLLLRTHATRTDMVTANHWGILPKPNRAWREPPFPIQGLPTSCFHSGPAKFTEVPLALGPPAAEVATMCRITAFTTPLGYAQACRRPRGLGHHKVSY